MLKLIATSRRAGLTAVFASVLFLAGCTNEEPAEPEVEDPPTQVEPDEPDDAGAEVDNVDSTPSSVDRDPVPEFAGDFAGIARDVDLESCDTAQGDALAIGSVTNSAAEARDVAVTIVWLEQDSNSSVARKAFVERDLPPGERVDFELRAELSEDARECVINARAGTLAD